MSGKNKHKDCTFYFALTASTYNVNNKYINKSYTTANHLKYSICPSLASMNVRTCLTLDRSTRFKRLYYCKWSWGRRRWLLKLLYIWNFSCIYQVFEVSSYIKLQCTKVMQSYSLWHNSIPTYPPDGIFSREDCKYYVAEICLKHHHA